MPTEHPHLYIHQYHVDGVWLSFEKVEGLLSVARKQNLHSFQFENALRHFQVDVAVVDDQNTHAEQGATASIGISVFPWRQYR